MFLYPLAITLILLALLGRFFDHDRAVYCWVTGLTLVAALYDLLRTLPEGVRALLHADGLIAAVGNVLPFATIGLGWVAPMGKPSAKRFSRAKPYVSRQTKAADQSGMCFGGTYRFFDAFLFEGVDKEARSLYLLPKIITYGN